MKLRRECYHPDEIPPDVPITPIGEVVPLSTRIKQIVAYGTLTVIIVGLLVIYGMLWYAVGEKRGRDGGFEREKKSMQHRCHQFGTENNCEPYRSYHGWLAGEDETW